MGCDIHYVVEKKVEGKWVGQFSEWPRSGFAADRDYEFFAELVGVRGKSTRNNYPRFLPPGVSELALTKAIDRGCDGHSHSWMPITEFSEIAVAVSPSRFKEADKKQPWEALFGNPIFLNTDDDKIEDYRVVFWFDN